MKFNIPAQCEIRWQAALAVLEDLAEDIDTPFNMRCWANQRTLWEKYEAGECGTATCFVGYISVAPYCQALGYPKHDNGGGAPSWLLNNWMCTTSIDGNTTLFAQIFDIGIGHDIGRAATLKLLQTRIKNIFFDSTGKKLVAPLTFYID